MIQPIGTHADVYGAAALDEADGGLVIDEALLVQAAQDHPSAFAELYERYRHRIYAYLRARTVTPEDADDLTQQVFVQALAALPRYRKQKVTFGAWLFRIAHNAAIDRHRRARRTISWDGMLEAHHPPSDSDPEGEAIQQDALARLRALLAELDADTQELLALRFAARLTAGEIGHIIGTSEGAAKKRLARAIQSLKEQYHDAP